MANEHILRAAAIVGNQATLAKALSVTPGRISQWACGEPVPVERAVLLEKITDGAVMRWDLRPDDWHLIWPELLQRPDAPKEPRDAA